MPRPPDDDLPRGRVWSRREALARLGAFGALAAWPFAAARGATPGRCVVTPDQTEGPFFLDTRMERSDVRIDAPGAAPRGGLPLALELRVSRADASGCAPLAGAIVDLWQCDVAGAYSGTQGTERFLRGYQVTDAEGRVRFVTVYPGWYSGRAVHLHFKVRSGTRELASQFYFDDALSDRVFARAPYATRGRPDVRNAQDFIYRQGGRQLTLTPVARDGGLDAAFDIALAA
jgi:protocatechuate 3,4-dioxygenase beta subunit